MTLICKYERNTQGIYNNESGPEQNNVIYEIFASIKGIPLERTNISAVTLTS